jgi:hypothetical protein
MRRALVRIDRMKLAWRLFRAMGQWPDEIELRQWLNEAGFVSVGGAWFCCQQNLSALQPDEILETAISETSDGITFVDRRSAPPAGPERRGPRTGDHSDHSESL